MNFENLKKILSAIDKDASVNKDNVINKIKEVLRREDTIAYQEWENKNFSINHTFIQSDPDAEFTLLIAAAAAGCKDLVNVLLDRHADVHVEGENRETALHHAVYSGCVDVVNVLLKTGADINVKDENGSAPLHYATLSNHVEVVDALLAEGASVHVKDRNGSTPLHYAAKNGYLEIVDALLDRGADVYEKDSLQKTPLYYAIINHQEGTVESIKGFLKNKVVQGSVVVGGLVAMLGNFVAMTLFITEAMEGTLTAITAVIAVSVSTALTSGYAKYLMSEFDNEIKQIKERQNVMEGRQSLTEGWQSVDIQSMRMRNALL
ncbi:ankyrin repeat domain-containing protein [Wolbachia endosymbiont of Drosophila mauritiana]|uniref:ankyrin repeat domain-containing protein n=1 Tax=unclassified Wolbachia TaxID=2640676 RepID=UPI00107EC15D|nr:MULTISPECIES: ankyrin repeat domain-containing protein [unclassified Wolbachia]QCB62495.1 ankyrin repeat domain-containing protein [Wolbachia endosymbiont of Drosophila mauritiana]QCB63542.1 ankyrin repeat domain-containing protein [Wolbachia endosymbiont of Drosophila mauritiana]QWE33188.1 Ankyrin repeat domain protein [Wolbachia endosymbiont of Drosophila simulans]TGB06879.1 ankyrin repeat domain-containing protein [Wolbachia endosymbiont of Drosophila mauritiana]